jgi:hypothetical protein
MVDLSWFVLSTEILWIRGFVGKSVSRERRCGDAIKRLWIDARECLIDARALSLKIAVEGV